MANIENVLILQGDITKQVTVNEILKNFKGKKADLIVDDGAPDVTGFHDMDQYLQSQLMVAALNIYENNRYTIYHGVNVVYKQFPFYPQFDNFHPNDSLSDIDLLNLQKWGFNLVRLHLAWEGVEPLRGQYNITYLQQLQKIIKKCEQYNIRVLLDAHQDLLSQKTCGEGFPDWAIKITNFPYPLPFKLEKDEKGIPKREDCLKHEFGLYYASFDVQNNFQRFLTNEDGIADSFAQMWGFVANFYKNETNVIGYEIINEPFGSSVYSVFLKTLNSNNLYLLPLYNKVHQEIRKYDDQSLLFYESASSDILNLGFIHNVGGDEYLDREVYSYHIYCPFISKEGDPLNNYICEGLDNIIFKGKFKEFKGLKVGGFLTEFGALSNSTKAFQEIESVVKNSEQNFHSWAYWQFKYYGDITTQSRPGTVESFYDNFGNLNSLKVKALSRTYAYKICGKPIYTEFDGQNGKFMLSFFYENSKSCQGKNTEIYLNEEFYYQNGVKWDCGKVKCQFLKIKENYYQLIIQNQENIQVDFKIY
ncbi:hypothetical protein IMG5_057980 [Ichthyophthirius multifiliis]|uniref:Glycoside hydrolase family 5 domain-containing protein n=1 Tax=Ichthyophthirius multifiliis TaxID=5932 RepID=G0QNF4_ICHMU|nr:hypothetical protein IMG5_057980 [Ichthyophthirius multifiliis]EGR33243.1 hypothetical protein IMG5_057980 [Ichthyophthirius multifiliis]|eukprot:XP_004037229.1 hypothetical protein IMG5_057980 [Ichthyophthirius multifiliis]